MLTRNGAPIKARVSARPLEPGIGHWALTAALQWWAVVDNAPRPRALTRDNGSRLAPSASVAAVQPKHLHHLRHVWRRIRRWVYACKLAVAGVPGSQPRNHHRLEMSYSISLPTSWILGDGRIAGKPPVLARRTS